jgi:hypothetical protein
MVTVPLGLADLARNPTAQVTVGGVPVGAVQLPGEDVADTNVAPVEGKTLVKVTPLVASGPLFVIL